ncbi:MAG: methionine biosynthesis protein MetW [Endomicrobium sp.]|jgi:methionine biosynthesis protein MetW|nr:methionine biosynthesis protein MetW [Endomicrobium sp.]MDR2399318.1 methionine biosynthesis protein MetW [Endomicrobium sp.]
MTDILTNIPLEYKKIASIIEPNAKVLDLGCGDGTLIYYLVKTKNADVQGIELNNSLIYTCVEKGLTVFHSDIEGGIEAYPPKSFDYIILHNSLQEVKKIDFVIEECFKLTKTIIIGFPNFAYITARRDLFLGNSPVTKSLPYQWYNSPNLRFLSIKDFETFCFEKKYKVVHKFFYRAEKEVRLFPNLFAQTAVFFITR